MALALKCDVCGKLYDPYGNIGKNKRIGIRIIETYIQKRGNPFCNNAGEVATRCIKYMDDLCPECMESIQKHICELSGKIWIGKEPEE